MYRLRKKTATLLIAIFMISILSVAISVSAGVGEGEYDAHLITVGNVGDGNEDRIVIEMPAGFTLGDLGSISWDEYLVKGYPPHVDVILGNGESLNFEYAYNTVTHYQGGRVPGDTIYGALTGEWYSTFGDDGEGPAQIDDSAMAWPNSGISGPYPHDDFQLYSLADWKAGITTKAGKLIDASKKVNRLEIEVDNWVIDTEAYVKNIVVVGSGDSAVNVLAISDGYDLAVDIVGLGTVSPGGKPDCVSGTSVKLTADPAVNWHLKEWSGDASGDSSTTSVYMDDHKSVTATFDLDIVSISVTPTSVNFGTVIMGEKSDKKSVTIMNNGNVPVEIDASIDDAFFDTYLRIEDCSVSYWSGFVKEISVDGTLPLDLTLDLTDCRVVDEYTGTLVFWATGS